MSETAMAHAQWEPLGFLVIAKSSVVIANSWGSADLIYHAAAYAARQRRNAQPAP